MANTLIRIGYVSVIVGEGGAVFSVNGKVGDVVLNKVDIGLGEVDNTSDLDKPISTATQDALDNLGDRITPIEERDEVVKVYAYENNAAVYADAQPGIKDPSELIRDGWYFKNSIAGEKINWYYFDGTSQANITLGDFKSVYAIMTFDAVSGGAAPILAIYTVPTGTNDAMPGFAHSRIVYNGPMNPIPVTNTQYLVYAGENPPTHPQLPRINLNLIPELSIGDKLLTEQILTVSFGSSSGASIDQVQYMVETLGLFSDPFKYEMDLRIRVASQLDLDSKISITEKGAANGVVPLDSSSKIDPTYLPSYVDDVLEFANFSSFPAEGETSKIYVALDTNKTYRWSGSTYIEISPSDVTSVNTKTGDVVLDKTDIGLDQVDNTSDLDKPVSNATQDALDLKYDASNPDGYITADDVAANSAVTSVNGQTGTVFLDKYVIGLDQVDNTSDLDKPISTATQDALDLKYDASNPDGYITEATLTPIYEATNEPTGFETRTTSTISFDNLTYTFFISPVIDSFSYYIKGVKFTRSATDSVIIDNTLSGTHIIYYDVNGNLQVTQAYTKELFEENALVCIVYWNTDTNEAIYVADERHGLTMDGATHGYLHTTFGARFLSGLALQNFSVDGDGSLDAHAQFTSDSGSIRDEDILIAIDAQTQIPVFYRQGSLWRKKQPDNFPFIYSGDSTGYVGIAANPRIPFNEFNGTSWQLTEVANNGFALIHLFATNDINHGVIAIQGINEYGDIPSARNAAPIEIQSLTGLPFAEFVAIGTVILKTDNYSNTPNATVISIDGANYVDFRGTQPFAPIGTATSHSILSGLSNDDHLQYHTDERGDARYYTQSQIDSLLGGLTPTGDISELSFSISNNVTTPTSITNFNFDNTEVRSFEAQVSVEIDADTNLYEQFVISGIQKDVEWDIAINSVGDFSGVEFSITPLGQIQYTSLNYTNFVSGSIKFRAFTTSI